MFGETIGLIKQGFLVAVLFHKRFRVCETVDTITVETTFKKRKKKKPRKAKNGVKRFSSCYIF